MPDIRTIVRFTESFVLHSIEFYRYKNHRMENGPHILMYNLSWLYAYILPLPRVFLQAIPLLRHAGVIAQIKSGLQFRSGQ